MDYQQAENQLAQVQQQTQMTVQKLQAFAQKLAAAAPDATTGREWAMDLREIALAMQNQSQNATMLIQQMAQYIQQLEMNLGGQGNVAASRGWTNQPQAGAGSGFLGSLVSGLGMGAGFAAADDIVSDIFNLF